MQDARCKQPQPLLRLSPTQGYLTSNATLARKAASLGAWAYVIFVFFFLLSPPLAAYSRPALPCGPLIFLIGFLRQPPLPLPELIDRPGIVCSALLRILSISPSYPIHLTFVGQNRPSRLTPSTESTPNFASFALPRHLKHSHQSPTPSPPSSVINIAHRLLSITGSINDEGLKSVISRLTH